MKMKATRWMSDVLHKQIWDNKVTRWIDRTLYRDSFSRSWVVKDFSTLASGLALLWLLAYREFQVRGGPFGTTLTWLSFLLFMHFALSAIVAGIIREEVIEGVPGWASERVPFTFPIWAYFKYIKPKHNKTGPSEKTETPSRSGIQEGGSDRAVSKSNRLVNLESGEHETSPGQGSLWLRGGYELYYTFVGILIAALFVPMFPAVAKLWTYNPELFGGKARWLLIALQATVYLTLATIAGLGFLLGGAVGLTRRRRLAGRTWPVWPLGSPFAGWVMLREAVRRPRDALSGSSPNT
jgi:hypothetical protein